MANAAEIRVVRCNGCTRVYDTRSYAAGAVFACLCGGRVTVTAPAEHTSPVIRCSACGGSRDPDAASCAFCAAAFTVRERDLSAMCASCGARASAKDTFCSACGDPIIHVEQALRTGDKTCPVCSDHPPLQHRALNAIALSECVTCGGVWLDRASFSHIASDAREHARREGRQLTHVTPRTVRPQAGPTYRRCVECDTVMQRKNYGRKSGVIVDVCAQHGIWFDMHEMDDVLGWLRAGGVEAHEPKPATLNHDAMKALAAANTSYPVTAKKSGVTSWLVEAGGEGAVEWVLDAFFGLF